MAMQMLQFKEHVGVLNNRAPMGKPPTVPWWVQPYNGDSSGHLSSPPVANGNDVSGGHLGYTKQRRGAMIRLPLFSANAEGSKSSGDAQKSPVDTSPQSECTRFNLGFGQPMVCAKYTYGDQLYGLFSSSGLQVPGRMMLPLNLTSDEGPIYVNAKQYHGILRRRKSRAKLEGENKATHGRKPYMHVSRHLHAMRRPRGSGGRFLNTKNMKNVERAAGMKKDGIAALSQPTGSPRFEVLQSNSRTSNSQKEVNGSIGISSGLEVTRVVTRLDIDRFPINHPQPHQTHSFLGMTEKTTPSIVMPSKWVAATDNRRNPKF